MKDVIRSAAIAAPFSEPDQAAGRDRGKRSSPRDPSPCWIRSAPTTLVRAMRRADRKVDAPLTMIIVIPRRPDRDDDRLGEDDLEIVVGEEVLARLGRDREEGDDQDEPDEGAGFREDSAECGGHGFSRRPRRTRRSSGSRPLGAGPNGHELAPAHHADRVAEAEELGQVGADEDHRLSRGGQPADDLVDLRLAADVDPAGGLVEEEDPRRMLQEPGERDLLLVAAGELADRLAAHRGISRASSPIQRLAAACLAAPLIQPMRPKSPSLVRVMLSAIGWLSIRPSSFRFSLRNPSPSAQRPARARAVHGPAEHRDLPGVAPGRGRTRPARGRCDPRRSGRRGRGSPPRAAGRLAGFSARRARDRPHLQHERRPARRSPRG